VIDDATGQSSGYRGNTLLKSSNDAMPVEAT
jgi:hypothetical protein